MKREWLLFEALPCHLFASFLFPLLAFQPLGPEPIFDSAEAPPRHLCPTQLYVLVRLQKSLEHFGTVQNLLFDMAGGDEKFLEKNLLAPYEIIAEKLTAPSPFP